MRHSKTCIIISGPTAVGKTAYSIELAKQLNTSIISADSRQCYRELNIGVAKPNPDQLAAVPHFFINTYSIQDEVNVATFEKDALDAVAHIFREKDVAVMVGGTGLYIRAFCEGLDIVPAADPDIREKVRAEYEQAGMAWLQSQLKEKDPLYAAQGEMQNPQRMLRALEVIISIGRSIISFQQGNTVQRPFNIEHRPMQLPREELYARINSRVDTMVAEGLLKEAQQLYPYRHLNALQTVGYRELFDHFDGKMSLADAVAEIKKNTRHYAKRQMTWFNKFIPAN